jgi:predicted thioesterase
MNDAIKEAFFDEYHVVTGEEPAQTAANATRGRRSLIDRMINTIAATSLIAVLECLCAREMQRHLKVYDETPVAMQMHYTRCAPVAAGARVRMTGWVERLGDGDVTFRVKAQDEQEQVCDGRIQFAIVKRERMTDLLSRKREAIARRESFAPA